MGRIVTALAIAVVLVGFTSADDSKKDKDKIESVWIATEMTTGGKKIAQEIQMEFKGDKVIMTQKGQPPANATFTCDPAKSPATMDIKIAKDGKTRTIPAIYELKGDELKLCHPFTESEARPTSFEGTNKTVLVVLKRQKT